MVSKRLATLLTLGVMIGQTGLLSTLFAQADTQILTNTGAKAESLKVASVIQNPEIDTIPQDILNVPESMTQPAMPRIYPVDLGEGKASYRLQVVQQGDNDASLFINELEAIRFRAEAVGMKAEERAGLVAEKLSHILTLDATIANAIKPAFVGSEGHRQPVILIGEETLLTLDAATAKAAGMTPERLAFIWANRLREAFHEARLEVRDYPDFNRSAAARYKGTGRLQTGIASWYGPGFHGRRTASGSRFNQFAMTAAHRTLPFGTLVRVTNQRTKKSCIVKINDRGPYAHGRIIDLSQGAARAVGLNGVARVSLEIVTNPG